MIPESVVKFGRHVGPAGEAWVAQLPRLIRTYSERWGVALDGPLPGIGRAAWVGGGQLRDGSEVVLKLAWPHTEAATEAAGLRFFDGVGAARLVDADEADFALLIERCRPGDDLWSLPTTRDADEVAASVLRRLWRVPEGAVAPITTLSDTVAEWNAAFATTRDAYPRDIVAAAIDLGNELVESTVDHVVVHGDFNPFNVLSAEREPWLAIDPKPLLGDRAYDLAQYLGNREEEAVASGDPRQWFVDAVDFFADALALDRHRIAAWAFVKSVGWNWGPRVAALFREVADHVG